MTIAPPGYTNRRGSWQRGAVIGPGPLPPDVTMPQTDPLLDVTMKKYYWDSEGRRHMRTLADIEREESSKSNVDRAMEVIRRAAANATTYKLDLKKIFEYFDTSGDGHIVKSELIQAFDAMGVKLDDETAAAIYDHFDPNHSGSIRLGEFIYAFFNRRKMVRQYKRSVKGLTEQQIKAKFHACDTNGNGKLDSREFQKLLKKLSIEMGEFEQNLMMEKFDSDGDGYLDIDEFREYLNNPDAEHVTKAVKSKTLPPSFSSVQKLTSHNNTAPAPVVGPIEESKYTEETKTIDVEKVDVLWMAKMLEEQEKLESKLGKQYFRS
jgi:calcium-binding protein CML